MYGTRTSRHFLWMAWFLLIAAVATALFYLIGHATSSASKDQHRQQIECLQAGGEMEKLAGMSGVYCNKDD